MESDKYSDLYRCKKTYRKVRIFKNDITIVEESKWYKGYLKRGMYYIIPRPIDDDINPSNAFFLIQTFDKNKFSTHFNTVDEHRESEINKILTNE